MKVALGFDTSCYTTSVALASDAFWRQERKLLSVAAGERGLRQSEAVFQHVGRMSALYETLMAANRDVEIVCVCASVKPRPAEDSYMPVFTAGEAFARTAACALGVPYYASTHQQGHIRAAKCGLTIPGGPLLCVHLSGGTTELLLEDGENLALLGGTGDISAGQLVDRAGVAMGMRFPAGPEMEKLARQGAAQSALSVRVKGATCSLSGAEAEVGRMLQAGAARETVAAEVFSCIARTLSKMLANAGETTGAKRALLAGGVASSLLLREMLSERMRRARTDMDLFWADPALSGDNAVGVACLGYEKWTRETNAKESDI